MSRKKEIAAPVSQNDITSADNDLKELKRLGKETSAINKRANQLMKKLQDGSITSEENAELDRLMRQDAKVNFNQLLDCMSKDFESVRKKS